MISKREIINKLNEFNKGAEELFSLSFIKKLNGSGCKIKYEREKGVSTEFWGPDDEAIKAFCNDIRKFIQKNDTLKIEKLTPFYKSSLIKKDEKKSFNETIGKLNQFKKKSTNYIINGENLTNEKILNIFIYGKFSHRTKGTKDIHDQWEKIIPIYAPLKNEFINILYFFLVTINNIVYTNKKILKKLS